jgi:ABC-2 type transport system permease protein
MRIGDLIKKDVRVVLQDVQALVFIFLMPIVLIVILGLALGGVFQGDGAAFRQIRIALVDEVDADEIAEADSVLSPMGASYKDMALQSVLDADEVASFLTYETVDAQDARALLDAGEADAMVTIPKGYAVSLAGAMFGGSGGAQIDVAYAQDTLQATIAGSVVRAYADTLSSISADALLLFKTAGDGIQVIPAADIGAYIAHAVHLSMADTATVTSRGVAARQVINSYYYYSIAITCMFILYAAGQGSTFLYTESEDKTLQRLSAAGVPGTKLLIGKSFAVFCLCILQLIVLFGFSTLAFGINWGNTLVFIAISICIALSVTGLGTLLMVMVYRSGNPRIGGIFQGVFVHAFALFGGSYIPLSVLPKFFSKVALITPNGLAIRAFTENVTGAPFSEIWPYMLGSIGLGIVLFFIGVILFPRERRA